MRIPLWGIGALVALSLVVGGLAGALIVTLTDGDDAEIDRLEESNARLELKLRGARQGGAEASDELDEAHDENAELKTQQAELEQQIADLELELEAALAIPPTPSQPSLPVSFGPGVYEVGVDMPPGTYRTTDPDCYWGKLNSSDPYDVYDHAYGAGEVLVDSPWFRIDISNYPIYDRCVLTKVD
jgi:hypothetical protein